MVVIHCLVLLSLFVEVLSLFCNAEFSVLPSFAKVSLWKKELVALLLLFSCQSQSQNYFISLVHTVYS